MPITLNQDAPAAKAVKQDAGHWYLHHEGNWSPLYAPDKSYGLRDARKDQAAGKQVVPSVTTIFKCLHKEMLLNWKMEQAAGAMYDLMFVTSPEEDRAKAIEMAIDRADNASKPAADLGTRIHAADENAHAGIDYEASLDVYVQAIAKARAELQVNTIGRETPCGSMLIGAGGKCDEHAFGMTVLDIKSRKSKAGLKTPKVPSYSTDKLQLSAYGYFLFGDEFFSDGRGIILAVSTTEPGLVTPHVWTGPELLPAFQAFKALAAVWSFENNFKASL